MLAAWHSLTAVGKRRRVRGLVGPALAQYDIEAVDVRLHSRTTNLLYRVLTAGGERLMLRLSHSGWRSGDDLRAEAAWLDALDRDTEVGAPRVVRTRNGGSVLPLQGVGLPGVWHATLMTWVEGRLLGRYLTESNLVKMGRLFAQLHIHGKSWQTPAGFSARRFDTFLSRGEPDVLFSEAVMVAMSQPDRDALRQARGWVEREYAQLDREDVRVIHCDLWHDNIKLDRGRLRPFDFEDTVLGFRLHDLAMGLLDLQEAVGNTRYLDLRAALRQGYDELLAWPEGRLEVLQIGRLLWKANWVARHQEAHLVPMVEEYGRIFRLFGVSGELRLPQ
jgi:Ser/Thr protein kinase RdoA (MazF antagonist)